MQLLLNVNCSNLMTLHVVSLLVRSRHRIDTRSPHPRLHVGLGGNENLFNSRPRPWLPPDSHARGRYSEDCNYQLFMDTVFRGLKFIFVSLDDILIASKTKAEHLLHLRELFSRLEQHGLVEKFEEMPVWVKRNSSSSDIGWTKTAPFHAQKK